MGWGAALKKKWDSATDAGRTLAQSIASDVKAGLDYVAQKRDSAGKAAYDAGVAVKDVVAEAGIVAKYAVAKAGIAAKNAVVATGEAVLGRARQVGNAAAGIVKDGYNLTAKQVKQAYKRVHAVFSRQPVGQPFQRCDNEDLPAKMVRLKIRKDLIAQGRERAEWRSDPERARILSAAERLEKNNVVVERAKLSQHVYETGNTTPAGWTRVSGSEKEMAKLGLDEKSLKDLLEPSNSGFRAEVYTSEFEGQQTVVVAFKGTTSWEDWRHNFQQGAGLGSDYYDRAMKLAKYMERQLDGSAKLEFTGHSLGGGMASAASIVVGVKGTTFNAAGLHPNTLSDYDLGTAGKMIDAYQVEGEILTTLQDREVQQRALAAGVLGGSPVAAGALVGSEALDRPLMYGAVGTPFSLPAVDEWDSESGQGYRRPINDINPVTAVNRHSMGTVVDGIEQQKADDVHVLQSLP